MTTEKVNPGLTGRVETRGSGHTYWLDHRTTIA